MDWVVRHDGRYEPLLTYAAARPNANWMWEWAEMGTTVRKRFA